MCIYKKNQECLTYTSREHVFPSCLGGTQRLSKGMVSDQANNHLSRLEEDLVRKSPVISLHRSFGGPGKRGSGKAEICRSNIDVVVNEAGIPELLHIGFGKPILIPQIRLKKGLVTISVSSLNSVASEDQMRATLRKLAEPVHHITYQGSPLMSQDELLIGWVRKGEFFVAGLEIDKFPAQSKVQSLLQQVIGEVERQPISVHHGQDREYRFSKYICPNHTRVLAKTALNTVAYLFGEQAARSPHLDALREWIMSADNTYFQNRIPVLSKNYSVLENADAHYVILIANQEQLMADVAFYGGPGMIFSMGSLPGECHKLKVCPDGMICDWRNRKDLDLLTFIQSQQEDVS